MKYFVEYKFTRIGSAEIEIEADSFEQAKEIAHTDEMIEQAEIDAWGGCEEQFMEIEVEEGE